MSSTCLGAEVKQFPNAKVPVQFLCPQGLCPEGGTIHQSEMIHVAQVSIPSPKFRLEIFFSTNTTPQIEELTPEFTWHLTVKTQAH